MEIKYTRHFLNKLEDVYSESDFHLRYEKGSFKSGYCVLQDKKVVVVNKYFSLEGKVNCLIDIMKNVEFDLSEMSEKNRNLYLELYNPQLKI